jgi:hypothetical protein
MKFLTELGAFVDISVYQILNMKWKTWCKMPTTISRHAKCYTNSTPASCHIWMGSYMLQYRKKYCNSTTFWVLSFRIQGIIWVYCIPHTSLVWVHLCSLGVTIMTRLWAIPQQSYAVPSRDEIYLFSKNGLPLSTQPKAWNWPQVSIWCQIWEFVGYSSTTQYLWHWQGLHLSPLSSY